MAGNLQPLDSKFAVVDAQGRPTEYFTRWAQQKQIDISKGITLTDLAAYLAAHKLIAGTGIQLTPDGNIADGVTIHADAQAILDEITATRGAIIYRGLLGWTALLPGTANQLLQTNGAGADPTWVNPPSGGGGALSLVTSSGPITISPTAPVNITGLDMLHYDYKLTMRLTRTPTAASDYITLQWFNTSGALVTETNQYIAASGAAAANLTQAGGIFRVAQIQDNTDTMMGTALDMYFSDDGKNHNVGFNSYLWENYGHLDGRLASNVIGGFRIATVNQAWSGSYSLYKLQR